MPDEQARGSGLAAVGASSFSRKTNQLYALSEIRIALATSFPNVFVVRLIREYSLLFGKRNTTRLVSLTEEHTKRKPKLP